MAPGRRCSQLATFLSRPTIRVTWTIPRSAGSSKADIRRPGGFDFPPRGHRPGAADAHGARYVRAPTLCCPRSQAEPKVMPKNPFTGVTNEARQAGADKRAADLVPIVREL